MPFPWKRIKKNTRLSQMLSDQIIQTRKGGGSPLVVETGFPTSLIDLFVKNKERLKRPSKKNNKSSPRPVSSPPRLDNIDGDYVKDNDDSIICPSSSPPLPLNLYSSPSSSPFHHHHHNHIASHAPRAMIRGGECEEGVDVNRVLVAILRMFMVVVVVLGTKTFVVGITMSAFLLVFLDYMGHHATRLLIPCTWINNKLRSMMNCKKDEWKLGCEEVLPLPSCSGSKNQEWDSRMGDGIREIDSCLVRPSEEIECEKENTDGGVETNFGDALNSKKVVSEEEKKCEVGEIQTRKSRGASIRKKMKKLVPKGLRNSKKKGCEVENRSSLVVRDILATCEEEEEDCSNGDQSESSLISRETDDGKDIIDISSDYDQSMDGNITPEEEKIGTEEKSGYVFLVLIVLVGLIGGRILALVLALTWCLMKNSGGCLRPYIKAPFLRSLVQGLS